MIDIYEKASDFRDSVQWAKEIAPLINKVVESGGQPDHGPENEDYTVQWLCPICEKSSLWMQFECGVCDGCFARLLSEYLDVPFPHWDDDPNLNENQQENTNDTQ